MLILFLQVLALLGPSSSAQRAPAPVAKTLAVLNFDNNTGRADYDPLGRGLAAMMITDLAVSPDLRLVERERMQDILDEQKLSRSPLFDSTTAARVGRLLGAEFIVTGSLTAAASDLRVDLRIIKVETGEVVKTARATGREDRLFAIEQRLADRVLKDLDIALSPEDSALLERRREADRRLGYAAFHALSSALASMDNGDYVTATTQLQPLIMHSSDSRVVQLAYQEAKRHAADAAKEKAKAKAGDALRGLFKKP